MDWAPISQQNPQLLLVDFLPMTDLWVLAHQENSFWVLVFRVMNLGVWVAASFSSCRKISVEPPCCVGGLGCLPWVPYPYQVMLIHTYSNQFISVSACWANSLRFIGLSILAIKNSIQVTIYQCTIAIDQSSKGSLRQLPRVSFTRVHYL